MTCFFSELTPRLVPGAVGEHKTVLSRKLRDFGERPNAALDLVADQAVLWMHIPVHQAGFHHFNLPNAFIMLYGGSCRGRIGCASGPDSHWKILGDRIVRSRINGNLQESVGSLLRTEHRCGLALPKEASKSLVGWSVQIHGLAELRTRCSMLNCSRGIDLVRYLNAARTAEFAVKTCVNEER
jgi:hypothetical protein